MSSRRSAGLLRNLAYGLGGLVLAAGWIYFFVQSRAVDLTAATDALAILGKLRVINHRLDDRLLRAHFERHAGTEPALPASAPPASLQARLQLQIFRFTDQVPGRELTQLKRSFDNKAKLVSRYLSLVGQGPQAAQSAEANALFERALLDSTGPRLDQLSRAMQQAIGQAIDSAALARVFLLYYSGFLVVVLGHMAWRLAANRRLLDRANQRLREANESLEARVKSRTRELSNALQKLKDSEALLVHSEKMSSLGQMVAGIVHEVNTPLAYVKASLEAVHARLADNTRLATETASLLKLLSAEDADESRLESQFSLVRSLIGDQQERRSSEQLGNAVKDGLYGIGQISEIVANLKDFSRLDRSKVADYDLHAGLESTLRIAHMHLGKRQVRKEFGTIPHVSCSPSEINQVFLNLITNAAHATSENDGMIILSTGMNGANHVWVDVVDNGHGIPKEVLSKIFDPFFTTKEVGRGTGLGLSICYKIVESHGGKLEVESVEGVGTRFRVNLPVNQAAAAA